MTEMFLCTSADMVAGGDEMTLTCPVCMKSCIHTVGYIGALCSNCGICHDSEMDTSQIVRLRRDLLKLGRKEMAHLFGIFPETVKKYEWVRCSRKYYYQTGEYMKANYQ